MSECPALTGHPLPAGGGLAQEQRVKGLSAITIIHCVCMAVHRCVPAALQLLSPTIRFAVWNHKVVMISSGRGSFICNTIKASSSHREGRQAALVLLQSVLA